MRFFLRQAEPPDRKALLRLARSFSARGFLTLPTAAAALARLIEHSRRSFAGRIAPRDRGIYFFVLERRRRSASRVIGCCLIVARHGTAASPHLFFRGRGGRLLLGADRRGWTELGGLILDPRYRGRPERLGKQLALVRFLYMALHPRRFRSRVLAELLPPLTRAGRSPLWEALGRRFTGLDYREADRRARRGKAFVFRLFPRGPIPAATLPRAAREAIGRVGPETVPIAALLHKLGFRYLRQIDPFDGGPHFGAAREAIRPLRATRRARLRVLAAGARLPRAAWRRYLVTAWPPRGPFRAVAVEGVLTRRGALWVVALPPAAGLGDGRRVSCLPC